MKENKFWDFISSKAFYVSLVSGVLVIAVVALVLSLYESSNNNLYNIADIGDEGGYVALEDSPNYSEPEIAAANKSNTAPLQSYDDLDTAELRQSYTPPSSTQSTRAEEAKAEIAKSEAAKSEPAKSEASKSEAASLETDSAVASAGSAALADNTNGSGNAASIKTDEIIVAEAVETNEQVATTTEKSQNEAESDISSEPEVVATMAEAPAEAEENSVATFSEFTDDSKMSWPTVGEIVMDFSNDKLIYDKTLDQYRTNNTICIASPAGSQVKSTAAGKVKSISENHVTGVTVVIDHGNGWLTTYGQLQSNVLVEPEQIVKAGQVIGGIESPTRYGTLLGEHLSFEVSKNDVPQDPKKILVN